MIKTISLHALANLLGGSLRGADTLVEQVSIDTRTLQPGDLFVAVSGERFDAHQFVGRAEAQGAAGLVVEQPVPSSLPTVLVDDGRRALGALGRYNRQQFGGPLVAVTGSSGKTTVKEMVAAVLAQRGTVLATRGNLNNEVGVPLTLLELTAEHQFAVVELGANHQGEIASTCALAEPDVAILNNAMGAHLEGFGSLQGVAEAKGEIFSGLRPGGTAIINLDDAFADYWRQLVKGRSVLTFSQVSAHADLFASHIEQRDDGCYSFVLNSHQGQVPVRLGVLGRHNIGNALAAAAAASALGLSLEEVASGLERFVPVKGRMQPHRLDNRTLLIDDSYNANPGAVKAAIEALAEFPGERVLVLGDMAELGAEAEALHREVGAYAAECGLDRLLATGTLCAAAVQGYSDKIEGEGTQMSAELFSSQDALITRIRALDARQRTILVKGSRSAHMDLVVTALLTEGKD